MNAPAISLLEGSDQSPQPEGQPSPKRQPKNDDPELEKPHDTEDLKKRDDTLYGFLLAHDYPDANPDNDLLADRVHSIDGTAD